MGAEWFVTYAQGSTAREAFKAARDEAMHYRGHGGYTGTIAEKSNFKLVTPREGESVDACIQRHEDDYIFDDKWGPAGAIKVSDGEYVFFGWASS